jgi:hypothetical protein
MVEAEETRQILQIVGKYLPDYTASHPTKQ